MKCDACGFFDCGRDCRCRCHPPKDEEKYDPKKSYAKLKGWDTASKNTEGAMKSLASLFG